MPERQEKLVEPFPPLAPLPCLCSGIGCGHGYRARAASEPCTGSPATASFPYMGGMAAIVLSWFISPLLAGIAAVALFTAVRSARAAPPRLVRAVLPRECLRNKYHMILDLLLTISHGSTAWNFEWFRRGAEGGVQCSTLSRRR